MVRGNFKVSGTNFKVAQDFVPSPSPPQGIPGDALEDETAAPSRSGGPAGSGLRRENAALPSTTLGFEGRQTWHIKHHQTSHSKCAIYPRESRMFSSLLSRQSLSPNCAVEDGPTTMPILFRRHSFP